MLVGVIAANILKGREVSPPVEEIPEPKLPARMLARFYTPILDDATQEDFSSDTVVQKCLAAARKTGGKWGFVVTRRGVEVFAGSTTDLSCIHELPLLRDFEAGENDEVYVLGLDHKNQPHVMNTPLLSCPECVKILQRFRGVHLRGKYAWEAIAPSMLLAAQCHAPR